MWPAYFPKRPSTSKTSPISQPYASSSILESTDQPLHSTSTTSPQPHFLPHSPHTPTHPHSLSRVDENPPDASTFSSGAPLVARDYAQPPQPSPSSTSSYQIIDNPTSPPIPPIQLQPSPKRKSSISTPRLIPPVSAHDTYLSTVLPSTAPRPPIPRSSTAPTQPQSQAHLSPSALPSPNPAGVDDQLIFEIFNAELCTPAEDLVGVLKGHLKDVLRAQEEVGRLHLKLEGLVGVPDDKGWATEGGEANKGGLFLGKGEKERLSGSEKGEGGVKVDDPLVMREKGVEEIMIKLGSLSQQLRTYHKLGTPQLSFPQASHSTVASPMSPASPRKVSQSRHTKPTSPSPTKSRFFPTSNLPGRSTQPASSSNTATNTLPPGQDTSTSRRVSPSHARITYDEPPSTGRASPIPKTGNQNKRNSNLSPLSLSTSRGDLDYDSNDITGEEEGGSGGRLGIGSTYIPKSASARADRRQGWDNDSIELVDRSRPW